MTNQLTSRSTARSLRRHRPLSAARRRSGLVTAVTLVVLVATGCTGGPGDRDDFVDVLTRDDNFAQNEAECIADEVFDEYGEDGDALQKISAADSYEFLTGEDGVDGFDEFFTTTVADCTRIGP